MYIDVYNRIIEKKILSMYFHLFIFILAFRFSNVSRLINQKKTQAIYPSINCNGPAYKPISTLQITREKTEINEQYL